MCDCCVPSGKHRIKWGKVVVGIRAILLQRQATGTAHNAALRLT